MLTAKAVKPILWLNSNSRVDFKELMYFMDVNAADSVSIVCHRTGSELKVGPVLSTGNRIFIYLQYRRSQNPHSTSTTRLPAGQMCQSRVNPNMQIYA